MIPDHIITKALNAWIGDHNCPHPDQISVYRALITRSLEAVAGEIWDEAIDAAAAQGAIQEPDNPYRPWRTVWNVWKVHNGDDRNRHGDPRIGRDYRTEASAQEAADRMPNTRTEVRPRPLPTWVDSL